MHRRHDVRMGVESTAGKAHISRAVLAKAPHQLLFAADHADRQSAADGFAVGDHVGAHAEIFLGAATRKPEADKYLIEYEYDVALAADLAQLLQPLGIRGAVVMRATSTVNQR